MISHQLLPHCLKSVSFLFWFHRASSSSSSMSSSTKMSGRTSKTSSQGRKWCQTSPAPQEPLCLQWVHVLYPINVTFCCRKSSRKVWFSCFLPPFSPVIHPQRTLNSNNAYEDGTIYRSGIGESTVSLDSTLRSAKSRNSYLAYALRYITLADHVAASNTLLSVVCLPQTLWAVIPYFAWCLTDTNTPKRTHSCTDA